MRENHQTAFRARGGASALLRMLLVPLALLTASCGGPPAEPPAEDVAEEAPAAGLENGSFTADLDGVSIHYEIHGQGPVMMPVPNSWGLTLEGLRLLYRPLEEHLTFVYFDPRGMGGSAPVGEESDMSMEAVRADFDALRRHLGLDKVHAIGWSNGAMNLMLLASERPETLESAIFLHGAAHFDQEDQKQMVARYPELFQEYAALQQELATAEVPPEEKDARLRALYLERWFPEMFAEPEAWRGRLPELYHDVGFSWRHSQHNNSLPSFDAREHLAVISVPSLVVAGGHDMLAPERVEEVAQGIPEARFLLFEASGHFAPLEEPEKFEEVVLEFLGAR